MSTLVWQCPCCLSFKLSPEELEQRYKSHEIDKMLEKDRQSMKRQVKLLLLGSGESGKSTFLKQMRIIHGVRFEQRLVEEYQQVIYQNLVKGMRVLVDARDKLGIPWDDQANMELGRRLLQAENNTYLDSRTFGQFAPLLARLWQDPAIVRAYERRREFQLVDVGGQRSQRQKWFRCFDSVTSILFLVSSSEFDQVCTTFKNETIN
nr:unnamed protein product [Callosobruchus analis]